MSIKPTNVPDEIWDWFFDTKPAFFNQDFIFDVLSDARMEDVFRAYAPCLFCEMFDEAIKASRYLKSHKDLIEVIDRGFSHWNNVIADLKHLKDNLILRHIHPDISLAIELLTKIKKDSENWQNDISGYFSDDISFIPIAIEYLEGQENDDINSEELLKLAIECKGTQNPNLLAMPNKKSDFNKASAYFAGRKMHDILVNQKHPIKYAALSAFLSVIFETDVSSEDVRKNINDYKRKISIKI